MEPSRYTTRRHWYEVVEEIADFCWWSGIIAAISFGLSRLIARPFGFTIILCIYPLLHLVLELLKWDSERYSIIDRKNGTSYIVKNRGLLKRSHIQDNIAQMGRIETSTVFGRYVGFVQLHLTFASRVYLDGQRVPVKLIQELDRNVKKQNAELPETERGLVISSLLDWNRAGLLDEGMARVAVAKLVGDTI